MDGLTLPNGLTLKTGDVLKFNQRINGCNTFLFALAGASPILFYYDSNKELDGQHYRIYEYDTADLLGLNLKTWDEDDFPTVLFQIEP